MSPLATLHLPASPGAPLSPTLSGSPTSSDSDSLISRDPSDQDSDSGEPEDGSSDAPGVKQDGRTWVRRIHHEWLRGAIEQRKKALVAREQAAGSGKQIMENLYNNLTADFLEKFGYALPVHSVWPKGVGMVRPPSNQVQAAEIAKKTHRVC